MYYRVKRKGFVLLPAGNYIFKVDNRNTRTRCKICSKLTLKTPERRQWRRSGVFIVNFEHISHVVHKIDNNLQVKKIVQYPMAVISNDTFSNFGKLLLMYVNKIFVYHQFFLTYSEYGKWYFLTSVFILSKTNNAQDIEIKPFKYLIHGRRILNTQCGLNMDPFDTQVEFITIFLFFAMAVA